MERVVIGISAFEGEILCTTNMSWVLNNCTSEQYKQDVQNIRNINVLYNLEKPESETDILPSRYMVVDRFGIYIGEGVDLNKIDTNTRVLIIRRADGVQFGFITDASFAIVKHLSLR